MYGQDIFAKNYTHTSIKLECFFHTNNNQQNKFRESCFCSWQLRKKISQPPTSSQSHSSDDDSSYESNLLHSVLLAMPKPLSIRNEIIMNAVRELIIKQALTNGSHMTLLVRNIHNNLHWDRLFIKWIAMYHVGIIFAIIVSLMSNFPKFSQFARLILVLSITSLIEVLSATDKCYI